MGDCDLTVLVLDDLQIQNIGQEFQRHVDVSISHFLYRPELVGSIFSKKIAVLVQADGAPEGSFGNVGGFAFAIPSNVLIQLAQHAG